MRKQLTMFGIMAALNLEAFAAWQPPIGIPRPSFGIEEQAPAFDASNPLHFYVDNYAAGCSDAGRGSPAQPRCSLPSLTGLAAGTLVQIAGGAYSGTTLSISGTGTALQPIFIRGLDPSNRPKIQYADLATNAQHMIIENLHFTATRWSGSSSVTYFSFRRNELRGDPGRNGMEPLAVDTVIYNNNIHHPGYDLSGNPARGDRHGITLQGGSKRVWIVDNDIHHTSGDGVQFCHANGDTSSPCFTNGAPEFVYIGRNTIHDNIENAVDFKVSKNVVVSQNVMYGFKAVNLNIGGSAVSSDGVAVLIGSNGIIDPAENIWTIFNEIYDSENGIRLEAAPGKTHIIGNVIRNIKGSGSTSSGGTLGYGIRLEKEGDVTIMGNTIYDADLAVNQDWRETFKLHIFNNLFANMRGTTYGNYFYVKSGLVASQSQMSNNIFYQNGNPAIINWGGTVYTIDTTAEFATFPGGANNLLEDPRFVDVANKNFHLQAGSLAIDKADDTLYDYASAFCATFGAFIPDCIGKLSVDFDANLRPQGPAWDMGVYEFGSGSFTPRCNDGKDNDSDGKIDMDDPGCSSAQDNDETDPVAAPKPPAAPKSLRVK